MNGPTAPCPGCLSPPAPFHVRGDPRLDELPASVAWLPGDDPGETERSWEAVAHILLGVAGGGAREVDKMVEEMNRQKGRSGRLGSNETGAERARRRHAAGHRTLPDAEVEVGAAFLSCVVLGLAGQGRLELLAVSHRPGWVRRLFGRSVDTAIHVNATGAARGDEGAMEAKLLEAVARATGPETPHGPSLSAAVRALFPSSVPAPARDLLGAAKEDAVARGVGRWVALNPPPLAADASSRDRLRERLVRAAHVYEILPTRAAAAASARRALDDLRSAVAAREKALLLKLEEEIEGALEAQRSPSD